ncbi:MAG TPA: hypothetical protein VMV46_16045 [Thermoanaerobaculia bacterium]|nr:hypothetical protein [Thermoanaerobaculia bacterium]
MRRALWPEEDPAELTDEVSRRAHRACGFEEVSTVRQFRVACDRGARLF